MELHLSGKAEVIDVFCGFANKIYGFFPFTKMCLRVVINQGQNCVFFKLGKIPVFRQGGVDDFGPPFCAW